MEIKHSNLKYTNQLIFINLVINFGITNLILTDMK